jgi:hypothetical protein
VCLSDDYGFLVIFTRNYILSNPVEFLELCAHFFVLKSSTYECTNENVQISCKCPLYKEGYQNWHLEKTWIGGLCQQSRKDNIYFLKVIKQLDNTAQ